MKSTLAWLVVGLAGAAAGFVGTQLARRSNTQVHRINQR